MDEDGAAVWRIGARCGAAVDLSDDSVALLDEAEEVGWMGGGAEVGPVRVLQLCNFAHVLERLPRVGEGEFADDDVGLIGGGRGDIGFAG